MDSPTGWTFKVGLNLLRREARRGQRERSAIGRMAAGPPTVLEIPDADVWSAVRGLPDRQRRTVVLRYVGDLPEAEIARILGVARGTVASNLANRLARKRFESERASRGSAMLRNFPNTDIPLSSPLP